MATTKNIEFWREFINLYRELPAVWKIKSDDYKSRDLKSECYVKLIDKLKELEPTADINCTKRKINTLRSNFRRELKKQINSRKSGAGSDDMYEPTVWYFNDLEFLRDQECQGIGSKVYSNVSQLPTSSSVLSDTNIYGELNYLLTEDDIALATPLDNVNNQNSRLEINYLLASCSSPIDNQNNVTSSFMNNDISISPIDKSEISNSTNTSTQVQKIPNLCTSYSPVKNNTGEIEISGRRIVNIFHLFEEIKNIDSHQPFDCGFKNMYMIGEKRLGYKSIFTFKCSMCKMKKSLATENNSFMPINTSAVVGAINSGCGYSQLQELMCAMEVPSIHINTYQVEHERICKGYEETALDSMKEAAKVEAELAIAEGNVDVDGTPLVAVVADGSWCKRSYRTMYNSLSGMAALVGYRTKKVLFMAVKNKFCATCVRTKIEDKPKDHKCFKNWKSSDGSSAMEAAIIIEGFKQSESMYGIRYHKLIADGDSSVYKQILDARPYKNLTVEKVECRNHLLRNFCKKLKEIAIKKETGKLQHRKLLKNNILRLRRGIVSAIQYRKQHNYTENDLRNDILNSVDHVFGQHDKCASYFCEKVNDVNYLEKIKSIDPILYTNIMQPVRYLARNSRSLLQDVDSNVVESLNGIIAKLIGGKRINFAMSGSYQGRVSAATLMKNTKRPLYKLHKKLLHCSPGTKWPSSKLEIWRQKKQIRQNELRSKTYRTKLKFRSDCVVPSKKIFLQSLKEMAINRDAIEKETIEQYSSKKWLECRRNLITASNFGRIICLRADTGCENVIKNMLYSSNVDCRAMEYGRENEHLARLELEKILGVKISECGLFIDAKIPFLGATPDGLIGNDTLVEIKCPLSAANLTPEEGIRQRKITLWKINKNKEIIGINTHHKYYYQVQGQLHVTERTFGIIAYWTNKGMKYETIEKDDTFWECNMFPKLQNFYFNCLLPELIDPRHSRCMPIRNPAYILEAKMAKEKKKA
ncbi:hypothetical protein QTP88_027173 [Uroleucon formosanum]